MRLNDGDATSPASNDVDALPDIQVFSPTTDVSETGQTVYIQNISSQRTYSAFSFEVMSQRRRLRESPDVVQELRLQAYRKGRRIAPEALTQSQR